MPYIRGYEGIPKNSFQEPSHQWKNRFSLGPQFTGPKPIGLLPMGLLQGQYLQGETQKPRRP